MKTEKKMQKQESYIHFVKSLPVPKIFGVDTILIFDRVLLKVSPSFLTWSKKFQDVYAVDAGEKLKDLNYFLSHMEKIMKLIQNRGTRHLTIVVAGGGTVGDFGGFVASILKRGVRLIQVPTTWLAAIDSSHGGKTALNIHGVKNQIGTFYSASDIYIVESLLRSQPLPRAHEAVGELAKIALVDGRDWVHKLEGTDRNPAQLLLKFLPDAIAAKYRIVRRDPREQSGFRQILNLGHTLGHVLESSMGLPHGVAVAQGTFFSIQWSFKRGLLSHRAYKRAYFLMKSKLGIIPLLEDSQFQIRRPSFRKAKKFLLQDKKRDDRHHVTFIFLKGFGKPIRKSITIECLLREARSQGWVK